MDYATLIAAKTTNGSICQWANDSGIPSATVVQEAEALIYRNLRHRLMLNDSTTGAMSVSNPYITLPTDHLQTRKLIITGGASWSMAALTKKTMDEVVNSYTYTSTGTRDTGQPSIFYTNATQAVFDKLPDQAYTYLLIYYAQPAALSTTSTNFITATYPRLMRCACMAMASEWLKDAGQGQFTKDYWLQLAMAEITTAQVESDREETADVNGPVFA